MKIILFILLTTFAYGQLTVDFVGNRYTIKETQRIALTKAQAITYLDSLIDAKKVELGITQEWQFTYADSISAITYDSIGVTFDTIYTTYVVDSALVDVLPQMEVDTLFFQKIADAITRLEAQKITEVDRIRAERKKRQEIRAIIQEYRRLKQEIRDN